MFSVLRVGKWGFHPLVLPAVTTSNLSEKAVEITHKRELVACVLLTVPAAAGGKAVEHRRPQKRLLCLPAIKHPEAPNWVACRVARLNFSVVTVPRIGPGIVDHERPDRRANLLS